MGRPLIFTLADKKPAAVAVELPVYFSGIISGNIRPVFGKIVGTLKIEFGTPPAAPGADGYRKDIFGPPGNGKDTRPVSLGNPEGKTKKTQRVKDGKFIMTRKPRPPFLHFKTARAGSGIEFTPDAAAVPRAEIQNIADKNAGDAEKTAGISVFRETDKFNAGPAARGNFLRAYHGLCVPGAASVHKEKDECHAEKVHPQDKKHRRGKGKNAFPPEFARSKTQDNNQKNKKARHVNPKGRRGFFFRPF
jgi:hypothetical protein